jgi:hypothetical protein
MTVKSPERIEGAVRSSFYSPTGYGATRPDGPFWRYRTSTRIEVASHERRILGLTDDLRRRPVPV